MSSAVTSLRYLVLAGLLLGMGYFGLNAYTKAIAYEEATKDLVVLQGVEAQASRQLENFAKTILGDFVSDEREVNFTKIKQKQHFEMQEAERYTCYFMYVLGVLLLSYFMLPLRAYTLFGALAAMMTLTLGLITPVLMVTIHKEVEYLGDIVLSFESKGVIGSIGKLFDSGDVVVALVILLFSVIVPLLKVVSLLVLSLYVQSNIAHKIVNFFKMIGKWSMVDVFVVALFLVYLTSNNGEVSRAEVEVGLYFFLAYVIVSMIISLSADKMVQQLKV